MLRLRLRSTPNAIIWYCGWRIFRLKITITSFSKFIPLGQHLGI